MLVEENKLVNRRYQQKQLTSQQSHSSSTQRQSVIGTQTILIVSQTKPGKLAQSALLMHIKVIPSPFVVVVLESPCVVVVFESPFVVVFPLLPPPEQSQINPVGHACILKGLQKVPPVFLVVVPPPVPLVVCPPPVIPPCEVTVLSPLFSADTASMVAAMNRAIDLMICMIVERDCVEIEKR